MAMLSISNNGGRKNSSTNRSPYSNNNGNMSRNNQRESKHCVYCNGDTHTVEKCFFLKGFPPGHKWHGREPPIPPQRSDGNNHAHQGTTSSTKLVYDNSSPPTIYKSLNHHISFRP
ncbi:hypothetical protein OIU78_017906 [Salix suchowensis]|nr:hypothetical protein OIU78_017906 [Salix suchowensis]